MNSIQHIAFKFELRPTEEQTNLLWEHFKGVRAVYNYFLHERKEQYRVTKKSDKYNQQSAKLTQLKKEPDWVWLKNVDSQSLQFSLKCLEAAYNNFFEKRTAYPKYHSCKDKQSFRVVQRFKLKKQLLYLPKFKTWIKVCKDRPLQGKIKFCDISYSSSGKYYVSITCEIKQKDLPKTGKSVGIDLGLKNFATTSDNKTYKNHKYTKKYSRKLKQYQQHLSRKQKDSKQREKVRKQIARIHEKIKNARHDTLHKISYELVKNYDIICIEDLNVKGMIKNRKLSKAISDASWGTFKVFLSYKAKRYGKQVVEVNRFFPSSKMCYDCGFVNEKLQLTDREWICPDCNLKINRDRNAAKNILKEGLNSLSSGIDDYTSGEKVKPNLLGATQ